MVDGTGDGVIHIDVGAYESQGVPHFTPGDYNRDGSVDACDYTIWRSTLGNSVAPFEGADGDGDGTIDADDYAIWKSHFGQGLTFSPAERGAALAVASGAAAEVAPALGPPPEVVRAANRAARLPVRLPTHRPISATNGDALLAWLSTRPGATERHDRPGPKTSAASDRDVARRAELDARLNAAVDAAFARIGA